jgi:AcrR family transcriptional regulator
MTDPAPVGLRERKRERLRERLIDVAVELFTERGFEATTIDQIAAAADVSRRNYFRYFRSKEDTVLAWLDGHAEAVADRIRRRPAAESPIAATTAAVAAELDLVGALPGRLATIGRLFRQSPALRAQYLGHMELVRHAIARSVAARIGEEPNALVPTLIGAFFSGTIPAVVDAWIDDGATDSLSERFTASIATLEKLIVTGRAP